MKNTQIYLYLILTLFIGCVSNTENSVLTISTIATKGTLLPYQKDKLFGVKNVQTNDWVIPPEYINLEPTKNKNIFFVEDVNHYFHLIQLENKKILSFEDNEWVNLEEKSDTLFIAFEHLNITGLNPSSNSYFIFINGETIDIKKVENIASTELFINNDGMFTVGYQNDKSVIYDFQTKEFIKLDENMSKKISEYLVGELLGDGKIYDLKGKLLPFIELNDFDKDSNFIKVRNQSGLKGVIDIKGDLIIDTAYKEIRNYKNYFWVKNQGGEESCYLKKENKLIHLFFDESQKDNYFNTNSSHDINPNGNVKIKTQDNTIIYDSNFVMQFKIPIHSELNIEDFYFIKNLSNPIPYSAYEKFGFMKVIDGKMEKLSEPIYDKISIRGNVYMADLKEENYDEYEEAFQRTLIFLDSNLNEIIQTSWESYYLPEFERFGNYLLIFDEYGDSDTPIELFNINTKEKANFTLNYNIGKLKVLGEYLFIQNLDAKKIMFYDKQLNLVVSSPDLCDGDVGYLDDRFTVEYMNCGYFLYDSVTKAFNDPLDIDEFRETFNIGMDEFNDDYFYYLLDKNGNKKSPKFEIIEIVDDLELIICFERGSGVKIYDFSLNQILEDSKIAQYEYYKDLQILLLSSEYGAYSFYINAKGEKLISKN